MLLNSFFQEFCFESYNSLSVKGIKRVSPADQDVSAAYNGF